MTISVQSNFGAGLLFSIPSGATPTPIMFGALQDVQIDVSFDEKMLYGSFQAPLEQARGKMKIAIKATIGRFDPVMFNQLFFGLTTTAGENRNSAREAQTIPGSSTYTVTATNGATFAVNLGVWNTVSKSWMTRSTTASGAGIYSLNTTTGVYTFNSADASAAIQLYYTYSTTVTGNTLAVTNQLMGSGTIFALNAVNYSTVTGNYSNWTFPAVQSFKLSMPMKLDDYTLAPIEMSAQDDGNGNLFTMTMTQ